MCDGKCRIKMEKITKKTKCLINVSWLQWVFDDWVTKINEDLKNFPSDIKNSKIRQYLQSSILKNGRKLKLVYKHKQVK